MKQRSQNWKGWKLKCLLTPTRNLSEKQTLRYWYIKASTASPSRRGTLRRQFSLVDQRHEFIIVKVLFVFVVIEEVVLAKLTVVVVVLLIVVGNNETVVYRTHVMHKNCELLEIFPSEIARTQPQEDMVTIQVIFLPSILSVGFWVCRD